MNRFLLTLFFLLCARTASSAILADTELPDNLVRFNTSFDLSGCGVREIFFSDIYLLGLYLPSDTITSDDALKESQPRIYWLKVLYKGDLPEDLPTLWREPLSQQLSEEYLAILSEFYDDVDNGAVVEFGFHPDHGEYIRLKGEVQSGNRKACSSLP